MMSSFLYNFVVQLFSQQMIIVYLWGPKCPGREDAYITKTTFMNSKFNLFQDVSFWVK